MNCDNTITHVIKRGDTIYLLAKSYGTTVPEILMKNPGINPYNLQVGSTLYICRKEEENSQMGEMELNQNLRQLWEQLSYWIRMYILSVADNMTDRDTVENQVNKIPVEMGNAFEKYYPPEIADSLRRALVDWVSGIITLASLVKNGEAAETDQLEIRLEQDVSKIAEILSNMNINYDREDLERELGEYLMLTKREIVARLSGEYEDDVDTFNELERQGLKLADYLSDGIGNQKNNRMQ